MEYSARVPKPSWAGLVFAIAILAGTLFAAIVNDDSFEPPPNKSDRQMN